MKEKKKRERRLVLMCWKKRKEEENKEIGKEKPRRKAQGKAPRRRCYYGDPRQHPIKVLVPLLQSPRVITLFIRSLVDHHCCYLGVPPTQSSRQPPLATRRKSFEKLLVEVVKWHQTTIFLACIQSIQSIQAITGHETTSIGSSSQLRTSPIWETLPLESVVVGKPP